jgi:hypothetical protein
MMFFASLMVVHQVNVAYLTRSQAEDYPPIRPEGHAPVAFQAARDAHRRASPGGEVR